ncbi:MAG: sterol desaturase family protein [Acidimicrobiia bacterium]|nr:sterol desaturase family protein [Acidimicrobiia bacterium]
MNETQTQRLSVGGVALGIGTLAVLLVALAIRGPAVFGLVVLAVVFVPLEKVFALHPQKVLRKEWATDVVHYVVNNLLTTAVMLVAVVIVGTVLKALVPDSVRSGLAGLPWGMQVTMALVIAGIGGYWGHRATHSVPVLWKFHKVHHSIKEMDWLAAAHLHPVDQAFTRSCAVLPLYALGFTRATFGAFLVFTTLQAIFIHANVRLTFGPLKWVIGTPEFHHWHHANQPEAYNTNFAGEFPWIDLLFGTLHVPDGERPQRYGIDEDVPQGYLRQLAWPFRSTARPSPQLPPPAPVS